MASFSFLFVPFPHTPWVAVDRSWQSRDTSRAAANVVSFARPLVVVLLMRGKRRGRERKPLYDLITTQRRSGRTVRQFCP